MSKNKRWYFIKLPEDFLESDPIEWLLTQDEGGNYFSMYILLCKIALNTEGRLVRLLGDVEVPYTPEDLSHKVRMSSSTVKVGVDTLLKAGLLSWIERKRKINQCIEKAPDLCYPFFISLRL